jgi:hypothetical protein
MSYSFFMCTHRLLAAIALLIWLQIPAATAQGNLDLQFPNGVLDIEEPIADAGPITIRLDRLEVFADLGPGPGGRVPTDRLLLLLRLLGEIDRLLATTPAPSPLRVVALPPSVPPSDDRPLLPLPAQSAPIIPGPLLIEWIQRIEEAAQIELPDPDNATGTYWPRRIYTLRIPTILDPTLARDLVQRLEQCEPASGWRPDSSVDWNALPLLIRGEGADPIYVERASADGKRFRVGVGLFLREEDARRIADSVSSCLGRRVGLVTTTLDGRNLALVYGPRAAISGN